MDILKQPKFKGDVHRDKPVKQFNSRGSERIGGPFGGFQGVVEPLEPFERPELDFRKSFHGHGKVPNKIKYR